MIGFYRVFGFVAICIVLASLAFWVMNRNAGDEVPEELAPAPSAPEAVVTLEEFFALDDGMAYAKAVEVIGAEGELFQALGHTPVGDEPPVKKIYTWTNPDASRLTLIFEHDALVAKEPVELK